MRPSTLSLTPRRPRFFSLSFSLLFSLLAITSFAIPGLAGSAQAAPGSEDMSAVGSGIYLPGGGADDIAIDQELNKIYVANSSSKGVFVIDGKTNTLLDTIYIGTFSAQLAINESTHTVYVTDYQTKVTVIDASTDTITTTIALNESGWGTDDIAVDESLNKIYLMGYKFPENLRSLIVIDATQPWVQTFIPLENHFVDSMKVDQTTHKLYLASSENVVVFDGTTNKTTATVSFAQRFSVNSMVIDEELNKIYISGVSDNFPSSRWILVIDGTHNEVITSLNVAASAMALDKVTHTIYASIPDTAGFNLIDTITDQRSVLPYKFEGGLLALNSKTKQIYTLITDSYLDVIKMDGNSHPIDQP